MDRLAALQTWLQSIGQPLKELKPASADASFRRYFRGWQQTATERASYIVMDAPPDKEDCTAFIDIAGLLEQMEIPATRVIASDQQQGFLLLSDLGNSTMLDALRKHPPSAQNLYPQALSLLAHFQQKGLDTAAQLALTIPPYTYQRLADECSEFQEWLLERHLGLRLDAPQINALNAAINTILEAVQQQPTVLVHLDYHSRNLMANDSGITGMLDFQDAVQGPLTYDAVSLLRDAYIQLDDDDIAQWLEGYRQQVAAEISPQLFTQWFDWMGLQRHIKVAGRFCRLNYRDGKDGYMSDIPLTLTYIRRVAGRYEELSALCQILDQHVMPEFGL